MISSDVIRGYTDTMVLAILLQGDSYGYEIRREILQRTGGLYSIKETTLYSAVNRLEKNGFLASYPGPESKGKPRTYFTITAAGKAYYREKCEEWAVTRRVLDLFTTGQ